MSIRDHFLRFWNFWPPFFFSGIKVIKMAKDFRHIVVRLKLRFWNANFVGTQYGGLIFSMTDPFYMIMLMKNLGASYVVWDKSAHIKYLRPGKTDLLAEFQLSEDDVKKIQQEFQEQDRLEWTRTIEVKDIHGAVVAEVRKIISIKKKKPLEEASKSKSFDLTDV
jgi:acyl-coenzyme A thioesterase PaaI-like protein